MLCQHCQQRDAMIHLTKVVNSLKEEHHLCQTCAASLQHGQGSTESSWGGMFESILPGPSMFGYPFLAKDQRSTPARLICPQCGETERELRETGLLGCAQCYDTFCELLFPVFRRAQGHTQHIEEVASCVVEEKPLSEIERLKLELSDAIDQEDYKRAAQLRDAIRDLEEKEESQ